MLRRILRSLSSDRRDLDLLIRALCDILADIDAHNQRLNDPNGDGGRTGTKCPDGDDFNELQGAVKGRIAAALTAINADRY